MNYIFMLMYIDISFIKKGVSFFLAIKIICKDT